MTKPTLEALSAWNPAVVETSRQRRPIGPCLSCTDKGNDWRMEGGVHDEYDIVESFHNSEFIIGDPQFLIHNSSFIIPFLANPRGRKGQVVPTWK